jgi:carboxyl-terminal processing protease
MRFPVRSRAGSTLTAVMVTLVASTIFAHQAAEPRAAESKTAILVCKMIEQSHISHVKINDEISVKLFNRYLELLDPRKLYFSQADVDCAGTGPGQAGREPEEGQRRLCLQRVRSLSAARQSSATPWPRRSSAPSTISPLTKGMVIDAEKLPWAKSEEDHARTLAETGQV